MRNRCTVTIGSCILIILLLILFITSFITNNQEGCTMGTFACNHQESQTCVPQRAICDGHADCPGGDDESSKNCGDFHGSQYVINIANYSNDAQHHECEQKGVPPGCYCRMYTWVYCKNMNLSSIPKGIEGHLQRLILANNSISTLTRTDFSEYRLNLIHLEGNGIVKLPDHLFSDQIILKKLLLMNNYIEGINGNVLKGLMHLSMIYLQHNRIRHIDANAFKGLVSLRYLDLSDNLLTRLTDGFPRVPHLLELFLDRNRIQELFGNEFDASRSLHHLGLSGNGLRSIGKNCFTGLENLTELDLSSNKLTSIDSDILSNNVKIEKLYIGNNPLHSISRNWFRTLNNLSSLDLEGLKIDNIDMELFSDLQLKFIYFDNFHYCSFVPQVKHCLPKSDGLSNDDDMLASNLLRVLAWIQASVTVVGNSIVIFKRNQASEDNILHNRIILNLADVLMGIYMAVIIGQDVTHRGSYRDVSHIWLHSWTCSFAGVIAMLSTLVGKLVLLFMSVVQFLPIVFPFNGIKCISPKSSFWCLMLIWIAGVAIATFPLAAYQRNSGCFYGSNAMCFPMHLEDPYFPGWEYSSFIFLGFNLTSLCIITTLYMGMFISIWDTRRKTTRTSCSGDYDFAVRFFFIILSNIACSLPITILKVLAFLRIPISYGTNAWIAVVVVPINSAFNPLLYTFTTPSYWERIRNCFIRLRGSSWHQRQPAIPTSVESSTQLFAIHNAVNEE